MAKRVTDRTRPTRDRGRGDALNNEYGVEGLWSLVSAGDLEFSPEDAVSRYLEDVERHRDGVAQHDDVTVMVLRRDSNGEAVESGLQPS